VREADARGGDIAVYARVSTHHQTERELPIAGQLEALRVFATQQGYHVVREYADEGRSGYRQPEKREALREMIAAARRHEFSAIAVWKLDRFARNLKDGLNFLSELGEANCRILSVTEGGATDATPSGEFTRNLLLAFAEFWSKGHAENVRRGMRAVFSRGGRPHSVPPYGYRLERRDKLLYLVRDARESVVLERIFTLAAAGKRPSEIAAALNEDGIKSKLGTRWTRPYICKLLHCEVYLGIRISKFGRVEKAHEPIITRELFAAAQSQMTSRTTRRMHSRFYGSQYLLSWCSWCGNCGGRIRGATRTRTYYACAGRERFGKAHCNRKPIRRERFERRVIEALKEQLCKPENLRKLIDSAIGRRTPGADEAAHVLETLMRREAELIDALSNGGDATKTKVAQLQQRLSDLEARLSPTVKTTGTEQRTPDSRTLGDICREYKRQLNGDITRDTFMRTIERITVHSEGYRGIVVAVRVPIVDITVRVFC
jgi:site-specific DNA recombinase